MSQWWSAPALMEVVWRGECWYENEQKLNSDSENGELTEVMMERESLGCSLKEQRRFCVCWRIFHRCILWIRPRVTYLLQLIAVVLGLLGCTRSRKRILGLVSWCGVDLAGAACGWSGRLLGRLGRHFDGRRLRNVDKQTWRSAKKANGC